MVFSRSDVLYSGTCFRVRCTWKPELHQNAAITSTVYCPSVSNVRGASFTVGVERAQQVLARCANGRQSRTRVHRWWRLPPRRSTGGRTPAYARGAPLSPPTTPPRPAAGIPPPPGDAGWRGGARGLPSKIPLKQRAAHVPCPYLFSRTPGTSSRSIGTPQAIVRTAATHVPGMYFAVAMTAKAIALGLCLLITAAVYGVISIGSPLVSKDGQQSSSGIRLLCDVIGNRLSDRRRRRRMRNVDVLNGGGGERETIRKAGRPL